MVHQLLGLRSTFSPSFLVVARTMHARHLAALVGAALLIGCGAKQPVATMTYEEARYVLAEEASRVPPLEVTLETIHTEIDKHDNPRKGERAPSTTRDELERSKVKIEAELAALNERVETAKKVVEAGNAKKK